MYYNNWNVSESSSRHYTAEAQFHRAVAETETEAEQFQEIYCKGLYSLSTQIRI